MEELSCVLQYMLCQFPMSVQRIAETAPQTAIYHLLCTTLEHLRDTSRCLPTYNAYGIQCSIIIFRPHRAGRHVRGWAHGLGTRLHHLLCSTWTLVHIVYSRNHRALWPLYLQPWQSGAELTNGPSRLNLKTLSSTLCISYVLWYVYSEIVPLTLFSPSVVR